MSGAPVLIAAGGTGGHLFPAEALACALCARGVPVELVTDERAKRYGGEFPARAVHVIGAATPRGGSAVARLLAVARLGFGTLQAIRHLRRLRPRAVVGFGGYPTVPPLLAASLLRIPAVVHEANAVLGLANRFLAPRVDRIAAAFPMARLDARLARKIVVTGNPVRESVLAAAREPFPEFADGKLRILVTGGSQGARIMADIAPQAIVGLSDEARARLVLAQQTREEDMARVGLAYARAGVAAEMAPFFTDLPQRIAKAHLVIARAGASTVSELAVIGRPSILVPLPHALDQDQAANAAILASSGSAEIFRQDDFTPQALRARIMDALKAPERLEERARAAKRVGIADAAERLADLVASVTRGEDGAPPGSNGDVHETAA